MEDSSKAAGIQVERAAGADRYDATSQVLGCMEASGKLRLNARDKPHVFVTTGRSSPNVLAASTITAKIGAAVVLVGTPGQANCVVAGAQLYAIGAQTDKLMANMGVSVLGWLDGRDRYDTANELMNWSI